MVKTSAGGYRAARKLRQRGSAVEEASQTCAWRRPLFWITSAGAVFIWTALVIFNWRVLAEDGPKMSGEVSLQSKVLALERDLNRAKEDLAQKDQLLAAYRETKDLAKERARPQPPKPEANLRGFTSSSDSPSPVIQGPGWVGPNSFVLAASCPRGTQWTSLLVFRSSLFPKKRSATRESVDKRRRIKNRLSAGPRRWVPEWTGGVCCLSTHFPPWSPAQALPLAPSKKTQIIPSWAAVAGRKWSRRSPTRNANHGGTNGSSSRFSGNPDGTPTLRAPQSGLCELTFVRAHPKSDIWCPRSGLRTPPAPRSDTCRGAGFPFVLLFNNTCLAHRQVSLGERDVSS